MHLEALYTVLRSILNYALLVSLMLLCFCANEMQHQSSLKLSHDRIYIYI